MLSTSILAHVKWFVEGDTPEVERLGQLEILSTIGLVVIGFGLLFLGKRWFEPKLLNKKIIKFFNPLSTYVPDIVRISTGVLLLINYYSEYLYAPNVASDGSNLHTTISLGMLVTGVMLISGLYRRAAAVAMLLIYLFSLVVVEPWIDVLDHVEYIGIGLYLLLANKGRLELVDFEFPKKAAKRYAVMAPRLLMGFVGLGLVVLAFSEKLANTSDASYFLENHNWNVLSFAGLSDRNFIIGAGVTELVVGLSLIINIATRVTTLALLGLMTLTAVLLGLEEVYGHLFVVGVLAIVWFRPLAIKKH